MPPSPLEYLRHILDETTLLNKIRVLRQTVQEMIEAGGAR
jgi:hypothetical protein